MNAGAIFNGSGDAREAAAAIVREAFQEPPGETRHIETDESCTATFRADWQHGRTPDSERVPVVTVNFSGIVSGEALHTEALARLQELFFEFCSLVSCGANIYKTHAGG